MQYIYCVSTHVVQGQWSRIAVQDSTVTIVLTSMCILGSSSALFAFISVRTNVTISQSTFDALMPYAPDMDVKR
jgi:hypothetical protein